jgi:hypothetical protein
MYDARDTNDVLDLPTSTQTKVEILDHEGDQATQHQRAREADTEH